MGRKRAYSILRLKKQIGLLGVSCLISTILFTVIFYFNMDRVYSFYSNTFLPTSKENSLPSQTNKGKGRGLSIFDEHIQYHDFNYLDSKSLTYEKRTYANNIEILFRLPKKRTINSLLLIFHGCSRSAYDWFHTIERQRIIGAAIDLGYGCLAFQSTDQLSHCWSNDIDLSNNEDAQMVLKGLEQFYKEYPKLESLPRFTFGASSGGIFSSIFVTNKRYKIEGQILFISIVLPQILETHVKAKVYPPTAWIYMLRDIEFASEDRINDSMKIFAREKIPHIGFDIEPIRLEAQAIQKRIPTISDGTSRYIYHRLQQNRWLDNNNYLIYNPRRITDWKRFIFTPTNLTISKSILENLKQHQKILPDFLNTIYGEHEISFEHSYEALKWLQTIYNNQTSGTT